MSDPAPPTVLFVAVPSALGGSNHALLALLAALEGKVRRVVAAPDGGAMAHVVPTEGLAEEYVGLRAGEGRSRLRRVVNALRVVGWVVPRRRELSAIHANATTGFYTALPAALVGRLPLVVWVHDSVSTPWGRRLGRLVSRLPVDVKWAAVSSVARSVVVGNGLADPASVSIVPNPVDRSAVVAERSVPPERRVRVGFLGAATRAKGFDLLPEVIAATSDLPITWKLFVNRKEGEFEAGIWQRIEALPSSDVEILGRAHDVRDAYAQIDVVFNPSRSESFSRVTAEGLMNGLPIVASDIPPLRDLLGGSEAGLLFDNGDPVKAAEALRRVVDDTGFSKRMADAARSLELRFEPAAVAEQMLDLYDIGRVPAD